MARLTRRGTLVVLVLPLLAVTGIVLAARCCSDSPAGISPERSVSATSASAAPSRRTPSADNAVPGTPVNVYAAIDSSHLSPAVAGDPERVYVPNGELGTVEVINPRTFKIIRRYKVGAYPEH